MEIKLKSRNEILVENAHKILGIIDEVQKIRDDVDAVIRRTDCSATLEPLKIIQDRLADLKNDNLVTAIKMLTAANEMED